MYCPPESGNIEPSSAKATQAHSEITPPSTHTRKNSFGFGSGPAMSLAVRKIDEPMMPLTSNSTESSKLKSSDKAWLLIRGLKFRVRGSGGGSHSRGPNLCFSCWSRECFVVPFGWSSCGIPIASSSGDSSGVPQRRQMTAEQSPHVSGSVTSFAHTGQYITTAGSFAAGAGLGRDLHEHGL